MERDTPVTRLEQAVKALEQASTKIPEHHGGDVKYLLWLRLEAAERILTEWWPQESAPAPVDDAWVLERARQIHSEIKSEGTTLARRREGPEDHSSRPSDVLSVDTPAPVDAEREDT